MALKIGNASGGEDASADGTEKIPVTGSKYMLVSTIAEYIRTLSQTLTNKTLTTPTISGAISFPDNVTQVFNPGADNAGINVGSMAGDPATPDNGDMWYDSTANELTARINGSNVALGAGGGGSSVTVGPLFPFTKPVIGDYTWVNQGSATATDEYGAIAIYDPAAANTNANYRILKKAAPTAPYTVTAAFLVSFFIKEYMNFAIGFREASSGKLDMTQFLFNTGTTTYPHLRRLTASSATTDVAESGTIGFMGQNDIVFLRLEDDNTNKKGYVSMDGRNFTLLWSVTRTDDFTPDEVLVSWSSRNTTYALNGYWLHWAQA